MGVRIAKEHQLMDAWPVLMHQDASKKLLFALQKL